MNVSCKQKQLGKIRFLHSPLPPNRYWKASGGRRCVHVALSASRCIAVNAPPSPVHASPVHALRLRCRVPSVALSGYLQRARPKRREMCTSGTAHCASKQNWATDAGFEIGFAVAQAGFGPDSCLISTTLVLFTSRIALSVTPLKGRTHPACPALVRRVSRVTKGVRVETMLPPVCFGGCTAPPVCSPRLRPICMRCRERPGRSCRPWSTSGRFRRFLPSF